MPRPRFQKLPHDRQERILDAAAREFAAHGYDGASLNHILEDAGISKGAAYYYFDDKADLFAAVVGHYMEHVFGAASLDLAALDAATFWAGITAYHARTLTLSLGNPWMVGVARAVWKLPPERRREGPIGDVFRQAYALLDGIIDRGQTLGVIRSDLPRGLLMAMVMAMDEAADRWVGAHFEELGTDGVKDLSTRLLPVWRRVLEPEA